MFPVSNIRSAAAVVFSQYSVQYGVPPVSPGLNLFAYFLMHSHNPSFLISLITHNSDTLCRGSLVFSTKGQCG